MKLSIVTITYNNLFGLKKTAESVLTQSWTDYEWIVIDGGSTDGSAEYLTSLERQPDFWCSEKDKGIYDALNKGILKAQGEYVCCMNSGDTFCDKSTLKKVFSTCHTEDILYGDWLRIFPNRIKKCFSPKKMDKHFFLDGNICHQAMFVKTKLLQESGFDTSYNIYADWAKWRELSNKGCSFKYVPVTVCNFEVVMGISSQDTLQRKEELHRLNANIPQEVLLAKSRSFIYDIALISFFSNKNGTCIWRGKFLSLFLRHNGYKIATIDQDTPNDKIFQTIKASKKVVLSRPCLLGLSGEVIAYCIAMKKPFAIDLDDALFHNNVLNDGAFLSSITSYDMMQGTYNAVADSLYHANYFVVSTPKLKDLIWKNYQKPSIVIPNQIDISLCNKRGRRPQNGLKLLYPSGTATHRHDLSTIFLDLLSFMTRHKDVTLTILGASVNAKDILGMEDRVKTIPYLPFDEMLQVYAEHDLVLVPLAQNEFNDSKSNIKYIEAGAVGVPVIATDVAEFRAVIRDGDNGFLFRDNFLEKMEEIYENRETLQVVGEVAYEDVSKFRSTQCPISEEMREWLDK